MVKRAKNIARKLLSGKVLRGIETEYRLARASYANARFHWPARGMRVIMITGTNGKTTTAHYLFSILRNAGYSVGLLSTAEFKLNNRTQANDTNMTAVDPVPFRRYLAELKAANVDFVILEATSIALDQHRLHGVPCEVAIMTNLTQEHLDYHKTMENYAAAKARLWEKEPEISVLNADDDWFGYYKKVATGKIKTYGKKDGSTRISGYQVLDEGAKFTLRLSSGKIVVKSHLAGEYNAYNALAAATAAEALGVDIDTIEEGLDAMPGIPGRLQFVDIKKPYKIAVDYAHTPDGVEKVLKAGRELTKNQLWIVFGVCGDRHKPNRPLMGKAAGKLADRIVVTDDESYSEDPKDLRKALLDGVLSIKGAEKKVVEVADRKKAIKYAMDNAKKGDLILVTGLGHEQFRIVGGGIDGGKKIRWNDADVIRALN